MREPHTPWSWLNDTLAEPAAVYMRTGIDTRPNEMVPEPSECGGIVSLLVPQSTEALHDSTRPPMMPQRPDIARDCGALLARRLPEEARSRAHARAVRRAARRPGAHVRRAEAR